VDENHSLTEFLGESGNQHDDVADPPEPETGRDTGEGRAEDPPPDEAGERTEKPGSTGGERTSSEPIATTYRWSADGGVCDICGERVESRWRFEGAFVCRECKEW
jgi:hypothetical protein